MRYPGSEKAEIIRLVEQSHLPAKRTLDKLGIPRATFYRWYDRYRDGGPEALADHRSRPDRVWNRSRMVSVARSSTWRWSFLSCRRGSWRCASPTRGILRLGGVGLPAAEGARLITSPAYVVIKAANEFYKRMLGFQGPAQPSPALGDALNAGYRYLEVKCLGCNTHQTVALDIVRRPKAAPVHELERYMRCKDCSQVRGYAYKRSHLVALRTTKITADDPLDVVAGRAVKKDKGRRSSLCIVNVSDQLQTSICDESEPDLGATARQPGRNGRQPCWVQMICPDACGLDGAVSLRSASRVDLYSSRAAAGFFSRTFLHSLSSLI